MTMPPPPPQEQAPPQAYQASQQPQQGWGAPAGPYASPIPVRTPGLGDAIASEWTKIRSVRSTMWTLGVMIVLLLGIGLLVAFVVSLSDAPADDVPVLTLGFFGVLLSSICVITLGVLTIASEYSTGMIRTTLTACPSRARMLIAKSVVFFLLAFTITTVTTGIVGVLQTAMLDGATPDTGLWVRSTVGIGLYVATLGLLSLAVGTIVRHSAGAITIMIAVVLLPLVLAIFMFSPSLASVQEALFEWSIPNQIGAIYEVSMTSSGPTGWEPLWALLGVTAVAMAGAFAALDRRDV
ncbi:MULTISPECIES: ABC transporter permease subunit [Streptomyces]|uniref:ABC transporter permease subunit n=1 Tax=Streptomyces glycanivorans TaxID=3033808 RepID=A0ABY9JBS8_9ACTN|nr:MULTISPECIES: ABC transporter permease subunit [unclassified Streptomyces]WSQ77527.1 ABC transporter permease subunit [Streptomyces sp. NBC_01213]TXS18100.1 ABC transporter permease [Streptomyces sp. wa22]WLQ64136.1 ABC transporter permease subunit [Streptomyces sp. Alt3]WSQ84887.1 ABC transporter permease subunit [Streptomyces sp. NBC_01212]WSR09030.1 ABC transporter permease subunit [Streptomyces sp. NBC_01208]